MKPKKMLITGGAGFIGSNFIRHVLTVRPDWTLFNLDDLTYAGNPENLEDLPAGDASRYHFIRDDIRNGALLDRIFQQEQFDGVVHFAAESHVDRSIEGPAAFLDTNVGGTFRLLEAGLKIWQASGESPDFRFVHISTDEVYGSLGPEGRFTETTPYDPSSPYSASKAASDHFVKAWHRTYGFPAVITNCSNNYGPYQFPEKLIPLMILNILEEKTLPVYGEGRNVRDWLYVIDHCEAILKVLEQGRPGESYNIGGGAEYENIEIVHLLCDLLDRRLDRSGRKSARHLIRFVADRPGHDLRYAIDATKIQNELGWRPRYQFETAIEETVDWYLSHLPWVESVRSGKYLEWIETQYGARERGVSQMRLNNREK